MAQWTSAQQNAIDSRGSTLLISAAAGSGKTAVLVERILRRITDKNDPIDIDRLLLVTFTNAAAAEMRARIGEALRTAAAQNPSDAHLRRQLFLIHRAKITTVHSFCLHLAREQAAALGIAPDFRLLDEREGKLLGEQAIEQVLEQAFEAKNENFEAACAQFATDRDDTRLAEVILQTYARIQSHPDPLAFLQRLRQGFSAPDMNTPHGQVLLAQAGAAVDYGIDCIRRAISMVEGTVELENAYLAALKNDERQALALRQAIEQDDWQLAVQAAAGVKADRLKPVRGFEDKAYLEKIKAWRNLWKGIASAVCDKWLRLTGEQAAFDRSLTAPALLGLTDLVLAFSAAFAEKKRERNAVDFNDLEHFAIRLLYEEGKPSSLARRLSEQFVEIAVDEYQDTNAVQDAIFAALSQNGSNLFMVGDVKQSIYRFRLADPTIFLSKYHAYADFDKAEAGAPRRIILGQNFRSRRAVIDSCNYIFSAVMGERAGEIVYDAQQALHFGAENYPEPDHARYRTELLLLDTEGLSDEQDAPEKTLLEARLAAGRIRTLIDEGFLVTDRQTGTLRPVTPNDIVILLRSPTGRVEHYRQALREQGLFGQSDDRGGLLQAIEVRALISLLFVLDNPRQDIELIAALRAPFFAFTEQLLADIRLSDLHSSYYDALVGCHAEFEQVEQFLSTLDRLRDYAADHPVHQLLQYIFEQFHLLSLYGAMPEGKLRQSNLLAFFERARSFEQQGFRGLYAFVRLLRGMLENGEDFPAAGSPQTEGAVRILSIHKSKGLEFPVVLLCGLGSRFNEADLRAPALIDSTLGFGIKCRDLARGLQYDSIERTAIAVQNRQQMVSEEMRVLYVALTRAKEKLILTASAAGLSEKIVQWAALADLPRIPQYAMGAVNGMLPWVVTPLLRHPIAAPLLQSLGVSLCTRPDAPNAFAKIELLHYSALDTPADAAVLGFAEPNQTDEAALTVAPPFAYPNAFLSELPSKVTATGLHRGYRADEAAEYTRPPIRRRPLRTPIFLQGERRLSPSEIGTAHHLFLQFCDFAKAQASGGVAQELSRMIEQQLLTQAQADCIQIDKIERFFASELYQKTMQQNSVRREFKFSVLVPACTYFAEAAKAPAREVLLQGVIDCLIETEQGYLILDFKTDRMNHSSATQKAARYQAQLDAYALAVTRIFERPVLQKLLYFLDSGEVVSVE